MNESARYYGLRTFIRESNLIEGINCELTTEVIRAHERVLDSTRVYVEDLVAFVRIVAPGKPLRNRAGRNVIVGSHRPPPGGPDIKVRLAALLDAIHEGALSPFEAHCAYEKLHPFMDGNGRSGRVLWAWHMQRQGYNPFGLRFLHAFYYQALDGCAMTRDEKIAEAKRRVGQGESPLVVGPELGASKSTVYQWVYPERYSEALPARAAQKRAWENAHDRRRCHCGALMSVGARRAGLVECVTCNKVTRTAAQRERRETIAALWRTGHTIEAIAGTLDSTANSIGTEMVRMRKDGWDLPYRYTGRTG